MPTGMYHVWRFVALAFTVVSIIVIPIPTAFESYYYGSNALLLSVISSGFWFLSLFWNIFVISWEKARKEVIHPGSVVALDLVTWLYGLAMAILGFISLALYAENVNRQRYYYYSGSYYSSRYRTVPDGEKNGTLACVAIFSICVTASTIIHFALFVLGCMNEEKRRKAELAARSVAPNGAIMPQGNHPVEYYSAPGVNGGYVQPPPQAFLQTVSDKQHQAEKQEAGFGNYSEKQAELEIMEANFGTK